MEGFIFLWRQSLESEVFKNAHLWQLWTWCLMRASHKERFVSLCVGRGDVTVKLLKGQFIFGRKSCAEELSCPPSTAFKRMKKLQEMGNISIKSDTHYSTITICNWDAFQTAKMTKEQPSDNQVTTKEQPSDTNNKGNKENKVNKLSLRLRIPPKIEWVKEYTEKTKYKIDYEHFFDHHEARGWKLSNGIMKDWEAAVRTWFKYQEQNQNRQAVNDTRGLL